MKSADIEMRLATITMEEDEFNHKQFLAAQKLKRSAVERTWKTAQQSYNNFVKVDRERTIKTQENLLKGSLASLENTKEELEQLQQMYDADELTEESEEIVLKRAKRAVESAGIPATKTPLSPLTEPSNKVCHAPLQSKRQPSRTLNTLMTRLFETSLLNLHEHKLRSQRNEMPTKKHKRNCPS